MKGTTVSAFTNTIILICVALTLGMTKAQGDTLKAIYANTAPVVKSHQGSPIATLNTQDCSLVHRIRDVYIANCTDGTVLFGPDDDNNWHPIGTWKEDHRLTHTNTHPRYRIPSTWELLCPCSYYAGDPL